MRYVLSENVFRKHLSEGGYTSIFDFSRKTRIHRNTILNYLAGKDAFAPIISRIAAMLKIDPLELIVPISESTARVPLLDEIRPLIAKITKTDRQLAVVLIGSRAGKRARNYSDWDIGITRGQNLLDSAQYLKIKNMVEELAEDVPRMVDVVNLDAAPAWFLKGLDYEPVFLDGSKEAYLYFRGVLYGIKKHGQ